jgi:HEPN domain-containing protein
MASNGDYARVLLRKAGGDEAAIRKLGSDTDIPDEIIGFHAQQAVEKAIKATLSANAVKYRFSHNLAYLRDLSKESGIELPSSLDGIEQLTPFAAIERYGGEEPIPTIPGPEGPSPVDRTQALKWATAAIAWARSIVEESGTAQNSPTQPHPSQTSPPSS